MKLDDEQFNELLRALTHISHGTDSTRGPAGFEALTMALSGDHIDGRASLGRQVYDGLTAVASSIDNLADALRGGPRLG
jgi:hypothetical protein